MDYSYFIILRKTKQLLFNPQDYGKSLVTLEKPDINPHIHIILNSNIKIDTLRKKLIKFYPMKKQVQIKHVKDYDKSIHYILKEFTILYQDIFTDEQLQERLDYVKEWQNDKEENKTNYTRYLSVKYRKEVYDDISDGKLQDYEYIEYRITLFLLETIKGDYKGFDQILINRWRNAIFNIYHSQLFLHKISKFLPNNSYAQDHELY